MIGHPDGPGNSLPFNDFDFEDEAEHVLLALQEEYDVRRIAEPPVGTDDWLLAEL